MRKLLCLCIFLFASTLVFGQAKKFDKKFGYFEYELTPSLQIVDSQNNHIVIGQFKGFHKVGNTTIQTKGDFDIFMIKYDASNAIVWVKTFGSSAEDNVVSLSCDKAGNIYFTGAYAGNAFYTSATDSLLYITGYAQSRYVAKLNADGNTIWSKRFSASLTSGGDQNKSEVINDHEGRLYLIHTTRANGTLSTWQFQDSVIANPVYNVNSVNILNVPRWLLTRLDATSGTIKWVDYIANPFIANNFIQILDISRPLIDKNNHLVFNISHMGNHTTPIYVFGQLASVNSNKNNILVRIDSSGSVRNFRDLGSIANSYSDPSEIALNNNNELVLINKKAKATDNGITYDYTSTSNTINYARIYDESFNLIKIVKLGQQNVRSFVFDKQNRLLTFGTSNIANFNQTPVDEVLAVDSTTKNVTFNTTGTILPYIFRYNESFKLDTFYLEKRLNPLMQLSTATNSLRIANNGDIIPNVIYPAMNMTIFRFDSTLRSKNSLIGKHRDREDMVLGMVEDKDGQVYTAGVIHGLANYNSIRSVTDSVKIPFESGQDNFIAKYNKEGNIVWIKRIATLANDIIGQMVISKSGIYFTVSNPSYTSWNFNDSVTVNGMQVLMKIDFNGNLIWAKEVYTTINPNTVSTRPSINLVKTLNNDNVIIGVYAYSTINIGTTLVQALGNRTGQVYAILNGENGNMIRYNRFALRGESFSTMGNSLSNAHEDKKGNIYLALTSSYTNVNSNITSNEIYSLKTNSLGFSHIWVSQPGILKLDSTLEMSKFYQFTSYMYLGDINGQGDNIYITGRSRNNSMTYNGTVLPTHSYAQNPHFVSFFARLDTALNITKISKFDTTSIESQFNLFNRKILTDSITKNVYQTLQFTGKTGLENVSYKTTSFGGTDLMFVKHDSTGAIIGAQHLGTAQSDYYSAGLINQSSSLLFSSRSVDPNYSTVILSPNLTSYSTKTESPIEVIMPNTKKSFSTSTESSIKTNAIVEGVNKEILSPDTYLSKYISLNELGKRPDTTILTVSKTTFCEGDSAFIELNDATSIKWKKGQELLTTEGNKLFIKTSGAYRAIIKTIEGFEDSTKIVNIEVTPTPTVPLIENVAYCVGSNTNTLTATASNAHVLLWYGTASTGGSATSTAITPSSINAGQIEYYVSQKTLVNACEGPRGKLTVTIHAKPTAPVVNNVSYCVGATSSPLKANAEDGYSLNWYQTDTATIKLVGAPIADTKTIGEQYFFVSQKNNSTGCESLKSKLIVSVYPIPTKPLISRLDSNRLTSNVTGSLWYLDTLLLKDTSTIIKPSVSGRYFVKTNQNGCLSSLSEQYYFLITDIDNLNSDEYIKFNPNPFNGQIRFDFKLKGINQINVEFIQFSTGQKMYSKSNIQNGMFINLPNMASGVYIMSVTSPDRKFYKQYKVMKL